MSATVLQWYKSKMQFLCGVGAITFLLLPIAGFSHSTAHAREKWHREEGDPIAGPEDMQNIDIVSLGGTQFRAYYMKSGQIYSALSEDDGRSFTEEGARFAGNHFAALKLPSGQVRIYYTDFETGDLFSKISDDGLDFTDEEGIRLSASEEGIVHPSVITLPDGGYRMYFDVEISENSNEGPNFGEKMKSASSTDGLAWTLDNGVRIKLRQRGLPSSADMVFSPFAFYDEENGKFKLYMTVEDNKKKKKSGVYLATSKNGLRFQILPKAVLGIDPEVSNPTSSEYGLTGNPQDVFIITTSDGSKLMYVWQAEQGYILAVPE